MKPHLLFPLLLLAASPSAHSITTGQIPVNVYNGSGFDTTYLTLNDGDVIGKSSGTPTAITLNAAAVGLGSVENTALSTWLGTTNVTTLGTITTGTWQGTALGLAYLAQGGATSGQALTWNGAAWAPTTLSSGITIDTTTVTGGTDGNLLYIGSGKVGQLSTSSDILSFLASANFVVARATLGLAIGTNVQAYDGDLTTWSSLTPSSNMQTFIGTTANWSDMRSALGLTIGSDVQAYDADLSTWAGITPGSGVGNWLATPSETNLKAATSGLAWLDTAQTFTASNTIRIDALGTTTSAGLTLSNSTAAMSGAQQMSPSLTLIGQGWKTDATAASQTVAWRQEVLPVQGSAKPSGIWQLHGSVNGADVANPHIQVPTDGSVIITGVSGIYGSLRLRHPDSHMGDDAVISIDGAGGMDLAQSMSTSYYGTYFHCYRNGAYWLKAYANTAYSCLGSSFNLVWIGDTTTAQALRVVNTFTSTTNWEAAVMDWQTTSNTLRIGSDVGSGGGTARDVQLIRGGAVKVTLGADTTDHAQPPKLPSYTVATIPSAATLGAGAMACITDATATTAYTTVAGGGSNFVLVISDGSNWIIH